MQHIENDMDDLFRRAAENYPLNTGKSDWEKIEKKLIVPPVEQKIKKSGKTYNYKIILFLLLLIFSGAIIIFKSGRNKNVANTNFERKEKTASPKKTNNLNALVIQSATKDKTKSKKNIQLKNAEAKKVTAVSKTNNDNENTTNNISKNSFLKEVKSVYAQIEQTQVERHNLIFNLAPKPQKMDVINKNNYLTGITDTETIKEVNKNLAVSDKKKPGLKKEGTKRKKWFIELNTDIDFSKVKTTRFEGPAFGAGLTGGYHINNRFFVETGVVSFQKSYYSLGNVFYEKGVAMPSGMVIDNLESQAKILEIPLKAGFYFHDSKKVKYFIAAGGSAYVMMNERNSYNVTMNGAPEKMEGIYKKTNTKIPAVLNVSAGLQKNISGSLNIKVEPYLKLPLQGIGVGKLPVTSTGIQIGISKSLK